ncbi:MAG: ABC transporter permease [Phyllobacterium sp.]|uniref:ABC transporter permease n=1 Tax=Phyllobacterium sp. TaxID=1871046 RepID=UPI0030F0990D
MERITLMPLQLPRHGVIAVATREVKWIWCDRVALFVVMGIPLIAFAILAATFSNAVIRDLKVDVVDQDRSQTSMTYVQAISSAPGVNVTERSSDLHDAMHAIRSGEAIAAVYIPRNFESDIAAGKRPQTVVFYNKQYFTPGNIASGALQSAIGAATAALPAASRSGAYTPGPLVVEQYVLTNPALNYAQFLLRAILPTVLHIVIAIAGGYAVGSEFGSRDRRDWFAAAGNSAMVAIVGKFAPYFGIFIVMMAIGMVIIHGFYAIPFRGDPVMMVAAACMLIIAYLSLGSLLQLLVKNLATGLTLTAIICSPAFGFAGVGFPVLAMGAFGRFWGSLLPLRWYIQILFDQAARGVPARDSVEPFMHLGTLAIIFFALALLFLARLIRNPLALKQETVKAEPSPRPGIVAAFQAEYGRILRDKGAFGLIVLGPIIYGLFYPQPYVGQLIRKIPIAVVDSDRSHLSRTIIETLDADEAIRVAARPQTLVEAQAMLAKRDVFGIVGIPQGTEREVMKGAEARVAAYADSAYFLLFNRTWQGITEATRTVSADVTSRGARSDGSLYRAALVKTSPIEVLNQPLFNPTGGYASYIVPAAFLLILQQTLLMGTATIGGVAYERGGQAARRLRSSLASVVGHALAHLMLALPGFALYLIVLPRIYGFSSNRHFVDLLALAIPFILAVSFMGQFVGSWFRRRETAVLLLMAISLPLFFLVGVAWPLEAIPSSIRTMSKIFPSTSGIDALVRVNQMGASVRDVWDDWVRLWILAGIYAGLAVLAPRLTSAWRTAQ